MVMDISKKYSLQEANDIIKSIKITDLDNRLRKRYTEEFIPLVQYANVMNASEIQCIGIFNKSRDGILYLNDNKIINVEVTTLDDVKKRINLQKQIRAAGGCVGRTGNVYSERMKVQYRYKGTERKHTIDCLNPSTDNIDDWRICPDRELNNINEIIKKKINKEGQYNGFDLLIPIDETDSFLYKLLIKSNHLLVKLNNLWSSIENNPFKNLVIIFDEDIIYKINSNGKGFLFNEEKAIQIINSL